MIVNEITLGCVAVQMPFAYVEVATVYGAFEDAKIIFDRVGMPEIRADVFLSRMVDAAVATELRTDRPINRRVVRHQIARLINIRDDDWLQRLSGYVGNPEAAHLAATLDQRQHNGFRWDLAFPIWPLCRRHKSHQLRQPDFHHRSDLRRSPNPASPREHASRGTMRFSCCNLKCAGVGAWRTPFSRRKTDRSFGATHA